VEGLSTWIGIGVMVKDPSVLLYRFWWEIGYEDHLQVSELKARDPRQEYVMKGQGIVGVTVKLNLSHMELPLCSGASFQLQ
jgi:hypothetical protein